MGTEMKIKSGEKYVFSIEKNNGTDPLNRVTTIKCYRQGQPDKIASLCTTDEIITSELIGAYVLDLIRYMGGLLT